MKLKVHASGSSGNLATLTDSTGSILMLDCGVALQKVYRALEFKTNALALCLVSSYHGDHSKSAKAMVDAFLPVTMSSLTAQNLGISLLSATVLIRNEGQVIERGNWTIKPFDAFHDALGSLGYLIRNKVDDITLAYAPDTGYIKFKMPSLNVLIVECNFDLESIEQRKEEIADRYLRVRESHMSLDRLKAYLAKSPMPELRNIVLVHLSDGNSNEQKMVSEIEKHTGVNVTAAREGLTVNLDKVPF